MFKNKNEDYNPQCLSVLEMTTESDFQTITVLKQENFNSRVKNANIIKWVFGDTFTLKCERGVLQGFTFVLFCIVLQ